jgi:SAM-dependent methyltransferase
VCGSKAPHRLAYLYFASHGELFRCRGLLLHVAPEPELGRRLRQLAQGGGMIYRSGGISGSGEHFLDIRRLPLADGSVHLIYCCHVLNAMQEDREAMAELLRVLSPQGTAVLQVPAFHRGSTTLETHSREERLRVFHDDGIYRCYTDADYVARLRDAGFVVEHFRAADFRCEDVRRFSLKAEVLHICRKPPLADAVRP